MQSRFDIYNRQENDLLFELPRDRVQEISSVTATVGKVYTVNKTASSVTINTGNTDTFTETDDWVYQVNSGGDLSTDLSVTLSDGGNGPNTQAAITGPSNGNGHVVAYQTTTLTRKNKSLQPGTAANSWASETLSLVNDEFILSKADIFSFNKVTDDTTNEIITYKFILDNGQDDNYYGPG